MKNKEKIAWSLFWGAIFLIVFLGVSRPALAQNVPYEGLDVVFVVDQSGSMGRLRSGDTDLPNDPLELRFYSVWYAMQWLGEDHLLVHPNLVYRLAVVNFGTTAEAWDFGNDPNKPIHWEEIASASRDEWNPLYNKLTQAIQGDIQGKYTKQDMGNTDFLKAFTVAKNLFGELPEVAGKRLGVVILLTDGAPNVAVEGFSPSKHLKSVGTFTSSYFPEPNFRIYVVGMIDSTDPYWSSARYDWEQITHDPCTPFVCSDPQKDRASLVASNDDVGARFQEIFLDLTRDLPKPPGTVVVDKDVIPGPLVVPPYLQSISFTYFKPKAQNQLILTDPKGPIDLKRQDVSIIGAGGPIEVVQIQNPVPGQWIIATDPPGTDVDITMRQIFARSQLNSPSGLQVQYVPLIINYTLLDETGASLPVYPDPQFRLNVEATVNTGDHSWSLLLTPKPNNVYEASFVPTIAGTYTISVKAKSQDMKNAPVSVFDGVIGSFDVSQVLIKSTNLEPIWPQHQEKELRFQFQDARGFPVSLPGQVDVALTIQGEDSPAQSLIAMPDGTYQGKYTPRQTGAHIVHVIATMKDSSGNLTPLVDGDIGNFDVSPTTLVDLKIVIPKDTRQFDTGLWPFKRNPLLLEVQVTDDKGNALDPSRVFLNAPDNAITVEVKDKKGRDRSQALHLSLTPQGSYQAETSELGTGEYDISISGGDLQPGYVYVGAGKSIHVSRVIYPPIIPVFSGGFFALAMVASGVTIAVVRWKRSQQHPCKGDLLIVDANSVKKFQDKLDIHNRNRVIFSTKDISSLTHIRRMEVTCLSDQESKDGQVYIKLWLDKDRTPVLIQHPLRRSGEVKVGNYNFWLLKDPDEDQLSKDRTEDSTT